MWGALVRPQSPPPPPPRNTHTSACFSSFKRSHLFVKTDLTTTLPRWELGFPALGFSLLRFLFLSLFISTVDWPSGWGVRAVHSLAVWPPQTSLPRAAVGAWNSPSYWPVLSPQIHLIPDSVTTVFPEPATGISLPVSPLSFRQWHQNDPCSAIAVQGTLRYHVSRKLLP